MILLLCAGIFLSPPPNTNTHIHNAVFWLWKVFSSHLCLCCCPLQHMLMTQRVGITRKCVLEVEHFYSNYSPMPEKENYQNQNWNTFKANRNPRNYRAGGLERKGLIKVFPMESNPLSCSAGGPHWIDSTVLSSWKKISRAWDETCHIYSEQTY